MIQKIPPLFFFLFFLDGVTLSWETLKPEEGPQNIGLSIETWGLGNLELIKAQIARL